ncbi:MAG: LL-diaminopimelate aminotransferase [Candidatus Tectomicrobia bacterium]|nr:LL-diaminopimelate aminotransferase [Candidatus Tectomicrobia bacterium]
MQLAERLSKIPPYLFMELRNKIAKARTEGIDVISLAIGDPVEPTPQGVIDELAHQANNPANHQYPPDEEKGMLKFRQAVTNWYARRYGVDVDPSTEVLALIGSKEGIHHFVLARMNPGEVALMTDPGYPAYRASILMGGGEPYSVAILPENNYLPKLEDIPTDVARKASAFFLNYPNNPTGAIATRQFFSDLVAFARDHDIALCHDNPYSEILFDGAQRLSLLSIPGAKEVAVELNSLSKPFNMTGWRIGMALGNKDLIAGISKVKENTDSGIFAAVQHAGIRALEAEEANIGKMLTVYARRRKLVVETLKEIGLSYTPPKGTFYLWVPAPRGMSSLEFTNLLFDKASIVVAAGTAYGKHGEGFIRISLTVSDHRLEEAMNRIKRALE